MKRIAILTLALLLLLSLALSATADYISGDGWWDDNYSGTWNYIPEAGLMIKLPYDWSENLLEGQEEYVFIRDDYYITLGVRFHWGEGLFSMEDEIQDDYLIFDGYQYTESANIILDEDRDWYIMANDYLFTALTNGEYGGVVEFCFNYDSEGGYLLDDIRRIISSISSY